MYLDERAISAKGQGRSGGIDFFFSRKFKGTFVSK